MSSSGGLGTGGGDKVCPEGFWTGGGIENLFSDFCLYFVLPKIKPKGSKDLYLALLGFFRVLVSC